MHKVYFILGCTACGKGAVGRELARRVGGQILSVDSMKVYRRMDIGTAKPSSAIRAEIPHHGIDLVEPNEPFSVAEYLRHADAAIASIRSQGAIPLAVGGTSLYIKALTEGLFEAPQADPSVRQELTDRAGRDGLEALHKELHQVDPAAAAKIHVNDRRRIVRALEVFRATGVPISRLQRQWDSGPQRYDCVFIGLARDKEELNRRINLRAKRMMDAGLRDEVASLLLPPPLSRQAAGAVGYAEIIAHLQGRGSLDEAFEQIKINTRQLAKKQRTWQRRFQGVQWFQVAEHDEPADVAGRILDKVEFK